MLIFSACINYPSPIKYCLVAACVYDQCWEAPLDLDEPGAVPGGIIGSSVLEIGYLPLEDQEQD